MLSAAKGKSPLLVFISFTRSSTNSSTVFKSANLEAMILGKQGTLLRFTLIHFDELQRPQEAGKPRRLFSYAILDLSYDFFFPFVRENVEITLFVSFDSPSLFDSFVKGPKI